MGAVERGRAAYGKARTLRDAGDQRAAADGFLVAADEFEASGEAELHAAALVEAGRCFTKAGNASQAIAPYRQAASVLRELEATRDAKARRNLARVLTNLGQALGEVDDPDAAFAAFEEAMRLTRDDDERLYAWTVLSVGKLYRELKRPDEARGYLSDAYEVSARLSDDRQAANAANNLGAVCNDLGEHEDALTHFEAARAAYVTLGDHGRVAIADANIARQQLRLGRFGQAEQSIDAALNALTRPEDSISRATALTTKSHLSWVTGDREQALLPLQEATEIYKRHGPVSDHAATIGILGGRLMELGRFDDGLDLVERSVSEHEHFHDTLRGGQIRACYLDRVNESYAALVGCYIFAGRNADALSAAERAKARTLALLLAAVRNERVGQREDELVALQRELGVVHESLRRRPSTSPTDQDKRLERRERELHIALRSLEATLGSSLVEPSSASLARPARPARSARDAAELLLEYVLAPKQSYLIAELGAVVEAFVLPPSGEFEPAIRALRDGLRLGLAPPHSHSLYRVLLQPVEHLLDATDELLIVPDGGAHVIFARASTSKRLDRA